VACDEGDVFTEMFCNGYASRNTQALQLG